MSNQRSASLDLNRLWPTSIYLLQSNVETPGPEPNPHIPFTADHEYRRTHKSLKRALDIWETSFRARHSFAGTGANVPEFTILPMLYLARLLLEVGPAFHIVPSLAGYVSAMHEPLPASLPRPCHPHDIGIHFTDDAVKISSQILEIIESSHNSGSFLHSKRFGPMWYPLCLFFGALVIWGRLQEDEAKGHTNQSVFSLRRILQGFHAQLEKLKDDWDCANRMSEVVENLLGQGQVQAVGIALN